MLAAILLNLDQVAPPAQTEQAGGGWEHVHPFHARKRYEIPKPRKGVRDIITEIARREPVDEEAALEALHLALDAERHAFVDRYIAYLREQMAREARIRRDDEDIAAILILM